MLSSFKKIIAVVVTYNTGKSYRKNFESILAQVDHIVIVDNDSCDKTKALLTEFTENYSDKVEVIFNSDNFGLAKAQNIGIKNAIEKGADWILFLDDDSRAASDMIQKMQSAYLEKPDLISIIAPYIKEIDVEIEQKYIIRKYGFLFSKVTFGNNKTLDVICVISSGSLIKTSAIKELGLFKEEFFIDYIDSEFCMRVIANNQKIIAVREAVLYHTLGNKTAHNIGKIKIITSNHSPKRRYTIYRNRIWVWKKYLFKVPSYILYDIAASFYDVIRITFFEKDSLQKLKQLAKGVKEGLLWRI